MSKRFIHSLLILIFAFLQCVSPLVHAHAEGEQSGLLHIATVAPAQLADLDSLTADSSAIISLSDDLHRYAQLALPQSPLLPLSVQLPTVPTHDLPYLSVIRSQRAACCTPPPQAPPVLS